MKVSAAQPMKFKENNQLYIRAIREAYRNQHNNNTEFMKWKGFENLEHGTWQQTVKHHCSHDECRNQLHDRNFSISLMTYQQSIQAFNKAKVGKK